MEWVLVEVVLFDEGAHRLGNEIADGLAARNPAANLGGRDVDTAGEPWELARAGIAASPEDHEAHESPQFVDPPPGVQCGHVVLADEIEKLGAGMSRAGVLDGLNGKTRTCTMDFRIVEREARFTGDGDCNHVAAQLGGGRRRGELMRRERGGDKYDLIELQLLNRLTSENEMTVVDWVESSAVEAEAHEMAMVNPIARNTASAVFSMQAFSVSGKGIWHSL